MPASGGGELLAVLPALVSVLAMFCHAGQMGRKQLLHEVGETELVPAYPLIFTRGSGVQALPR